MKNTSLKTLKELMKAFLNSEKNLRAEKITTLGEQPFPYLETLSSTAQTGFL